MTENLMVPPVVDQPENLMAPTVGPSPNHMPPTVGPSAGLPPLPPAAPSQPCPVCGMALSPYVGSPDTAPWQCPNLAAHRNGFWQAELDERSHYDARTRSMHHSVVSKVLVAIAQERVAARKRGTSLRPDQLRHLTQAQLAALAADGQVQAQFRAQARSLVVQVPS